MNDIDVIGQDGHDEGGLDSDGMDGIPVRSDSLFSLYVPGGGACTDDDYDDDDRAETSSSHGELNSSSIKSSRLTNPRVDGRQIKQPQPQQQTSAGLAGVQLNLRKKSIHRSRAAVLQRFQQRSRRGKDDFPSITKPSTNVVSIAALKAALSQSPLSYLDTGDLYPSMSTTGQQSKTVFVSDYI